MSLTVRLQRALASLANAQIAAGQDAYMKQAIRHRGIKTPAVVQAVKLFAASPQGQALTEAPATARAVGYELLQQPFSEDKLAGMLVLRDYYLPHHAAAWQEELAAVAQLYLDGHIPNWSTSDWVCARVLAPMVKAQRAASLQELEACSRAIAAWSTAEWAGGSDAALVWLRRSSVVAFVGVANAGDGDMFPGFGAMLLQASGAVVREQHRFCQTGVGWVVRELGKRNSAALLRFCDDHLAYFSSEGLRYALEHQPAVVRKRLMAAHKETGRRGGRNGGGDVEVGKAAAPCRKSGKRKQCLTHVSKCTQTAGLLPRTTLGIASYIFY